MIDWFVWLSPLWVLVLIVPFVFLGCGELLGADPDPALGSDVTLSYGDAVRAEDAPHSLSASPVSERRVNVITVDWTLLQGSTVFRQPATEIKGSGANVIDPFDTPFVLPVGHHDPTGVVSDVACSCVLLLDDGTTFTVNHSVKYGKAAVHFRLVRGLRRMTAPNKFVSDPVFSLTSETVTN